jgi:hypothetical protein
LLEITSRSWTWWSLPWAEAIGTCKITHDKVRLFSTITTKPLNVERRRKIRTRPSLIRAAGPPRATRPTKTKTWQFLARVLGPPKATRPTKIGAQAFSARAAQDH